MINSNYKAIGVVTATLYDGNGNVKQKETNHNTIVLTGCELIASLLSGVDVMERPSHMAVGKGSTATKRSMICLEDEVAGSRTTFDTGYPSRSGSQITYTTTFGPTKGSGVLREVGIFNSEGTGSGCSLSPVIEGGKIVSVTVNSGGKGYTALDTVSIVTDTGSGCQLSHTIDDTGKVTSVTVVQQGSNYAATDTACITSGGTMMNRVTFPIITKESADTLIVQWAVTIS